MAINRMLDNSVRAEAEQDGQGAGWAVRWTRRRFDSNDTQRAAAALIFDVEAHS